jgi:hypothetical protein
MRNQYEMSEAYTLQLEIEVLRERVKELESQIKQKEDERIVSMAEIDVAFANYLKTIKVF